MSAWIMSFLREEDGPAAVEYAVMLAMILLVCLGSIQLVGTKVAASFADSAAKMSAAGLGP